MNSKAKRYSIIMMGASGAVGTHTLQTLIQYNNIQQLTLLGRKTIPNITAKIVNQYEINIHDATTYQQFIAGHNVAICTLGVGEPSKISKEAFIKIDKIAVLDFAKACKKAGVQHFELLASVGSNPKSFSFYLRTKGELVEELKALNFDRLSIFNPSMILTPKNRYGISQAIILKIWPLLNPLFFGNLKKYRGIPVNILGKAIGKNIFIDNHGFEQLHWEDFYSIIRN